MNKKQQGCIGIIARLGSKRLNDKHLININDQPIISYLIQRIKKEFVKEIKNEQIEIFILTGNRRINKQLGQIAIENDISIYFGHNTNIPRRMFGIIKEKFFNFIISVDGDDILCAPEGMRQVYNSILEGNQYVKTVGYPFGMNSMGMTKNFLSNSLNGKGDRNLETGWGWIFDEKQCKNIGDTIPSDERLRFTLDYPDDLVFFKNIINSNLDVLSVSTSDLINFVLKNKIYFKNMDLNKEYWEKFKTQKLLEMKE